MWQKVYFYAQKKMFCPQDASFRASKKTPSRHREEVLQVLIPLPSATQQIPIDEIDYWTEEEEFYGVELH